MNDLEFSAMGAKWKITGDFSCGNMIIEEAQKFEKMYSRFIPDSFVVKLSKARGIVSVPADFMAMLEWYFKLFDITDGRFSPLIGNTISDMGYDHEYSLNASEKIRSVPNLKETVKIIDNETIEILRPVLFDFGGLGKGYFVDKIVKVLRECGSIRFLVNGSGDIYVSGQTIRAGLEDPGDFSKVIGVVEINEGAMCSSATNRRKWREFQHIFDAKSLDMNSEIIASWVIAEETALADAIATCLFLCEPEKLSRHFNFEYCLLNKDYKVKISKEFNAELF